MTYFSLSVEMKASSERVWEVLSNIERTLGSDRVSS